MNPVVHLVVDPPSPFTMLCVACFNRGATRARVSCRVEDSPPFASLHLRCEECGMEATWPPGGSPEMTMPPRS
jgi:hypothetical protein